MRFALVVGLAAAMLVGCSSNNGGNTTGAAGTGGTTGTGGAAGAAGSGGAGGGGAGGGGGAAGAAGTTGLAGAGGSAGGAAGTTGAGGGGTGGAGAGAGGAAGSGAGGSTAGNPCSTRPGMIFCDMFESAPAGAAPPSPWSTGINGAGTVTVDATTPAHSGTKSVHIADGANDYDTLLVLHSSSILPVASGRFYVRAFMRLGAAMSAGHNSFILADLFATQGQGNSLRVGEDYQMLMYTLMGDTHGALSNQNYFNDGKPGVSFTPNTWTCLELLLDHGGPEVDVWVDGVEVPDLHHTDWPVDSYDNVRFGFEKYAGPAVDIWYDDIAVGTQRIGCN